MEMLTPFPRLLSTLVLLAGASAFGAMASVGCSSSSESNTPTSGNLAGTSGAGGGAGTTSVAGASGAAAGVGGMTAGGSSGAAGASGMNGGSGGASAGTGGAGGNTGGQAGTGGATAGAGGSTGGASGSSAGAGASGASGASGQSAALFTAAIKGDAACGACIAAITGTVVDAAGDDIDCTGILAKCDGDQKCEDFFDATKYASEQGVDTDPNCWIDAGLTLVPENVPNTLFICTVGRCENECGLSFAPPMNCD